MSENDIAKIVVDSALQIYKVLGPGLLESVYEELLAHDLIKRGLEVERQKSFGILYDEVKLDIGFRADIVVNNKLIIEIKSVEEIAPVHYKQLLTYLRILDFRLGLLINFNVALIKNGIKRIANGF